MSRKIKHTILLIAGVGISFIFILFAEPLPQDPSYHLFSDKRLIFGIKNALNVLTNIPLVFVGVVGTFRLMDSSRYLSDKQGGVPYIVFFVSVALIGLGSGYYHLEPSNQTLVWDRLPMTIAFMSFFSAVISDHIHERLGYYLLLPLGVVGLASVLYWHFTEQNAVGDLRAYALVQFLPILLIPMILILYDSSYTRSRDVYGILLFYILAKIFEHFDREVYEILGWLSGHSIKHLMSAFATYWVLRMLKLREKR